MKTNYGLLMLATSLTLATSSIAQNQEKRIEKGVENKNITTQEKIENAKKATELDGKVSPREARKLEKMQNRASRNIRNKSKNSKKI
jgi:hypothetical protein